MSTKTPHPRPERQDTDQSLDSERKKTDEELARRQSGVEEASDEVVARARERADAVLAKARTEADARLEREGTTSTQRRTMDTERARENTALSEERRVADAELDEERDARRRVMQSLLRLEREQTDEHLLTERARADEAIASRDDFMGMVSHDLRTLLGGIALSAAMQIRNAPEGDAGKQVVKEAQRIQHFTARMNRLIGDLIDVASIEAGRLHVRPSNDDAARLVRETLEAFQPGAAAKGVALKAELQSDSVLATFDRERILQVLANLLSNAIKFTPAGGTVMLRVEPVGEEIRFSVEDTGMGIPVENLEQIFERFWQARHADRRGLGLGLYISKCIVEAHGGRIWATSDPGKGSTFCFTLPRGARAQG